ncbi:hypothetical protein Lalb_Chr13g0301251 [Lupinus albus]|uniref:Uncharacterized protein n=1 Tax=Lupinus albus TaxID=3870 RepID=A0A6A4PJW1_LUPAL|nr:hypothetical protein Lalb_Chr13g0301251 [Lupinus albus]
MIALFEDFLETRNQYYWSWIWKLPVQQKLRFFVWLCWYKKTANFEQVFWPTHCHVSHSLGASVVHLTSIFYVFSFV